MPSPFGSCGGELLVADAAASLADADLDALLRGLLDLGFHNAFLLSCLCLSLSLRLETHDGFPFSLMTQGNN